MASVICAKPRSVGSRCDHRCHGRGAGFGVVASVALVAAGEGFAAWGLSTARFTGQTARNPIRMRQPLAPIIIAYVFGIVLGDLLDLPVPGWLLLGFVLLAPCLRLDRSRPWFLLPLLMVCGAVSLTLSQKTISPIDLRRVLAPEPSLVTVRGLVERVDLRATTTTADDGVLRATARLRLSALRVGNGRWLPVIGTLLASTKTVGESPLRSGQRVEVTGVSEAPARAFARGMFDYRAHLARRGIFHQLEFEGPGDLRVLVDAPPPLTDRFQRWAMRVLGQGFPAGDPAIGMLWALCVGWLVPLTVEVAEPFMRSGTMHLFAISGQHVALIAGILVALLRLVRVPRRAVGWLVIPILWFYTAATGWQPSAVRSTIMMTVIVLGWTLERPVDLLNSLAAAALLILIWDPQQLFQAGFQLSFCVVASIGLFLPRIEQWRRRLLRTDPLLPVELRPRWQRWLDAPVRWVTVSVAVSLAAWLGSLPLIMAYFHLLTPVSLAANIVVVHLGSLALAAALGSVLCFPIVPFLAELFNHAAWFFSHAMASSSAWFAQWPGAWCYVRTPPLTSIACYYALLWLLMSGRFWRQRRWAIPTAFALALIAVGAWRHEHDHVRLSILPLNGGHALYLDQPGRDNWLIDCGDELAWRFRTRPFLQAQGVNHLDHFVGTHGDIRHIGAATNVLADYAPPRLVLSPVPQRSTAHRRLERAAEESRIAVLRPVAGEVIDPWTVFYPAGSSPQPRADSSALVMRLELTGVSILHVPDLDRDGAKIWLATPQVGGVQALVVSPAAGGVIAVEEAIGQLRPKLLIVVDSVVPAIDRLRNQTKDRLRQLAPTVMFTTETGAIELRFSGDGNDLEVTSFPR